LNRFKIPSAGNKDAKAARQMSRRLKADVNQVEKEHKAVEKAVEEKEAELRITIDRIDSENGPFQKQLQEVCLTCYK